MSQVFRNLLSNAMKFTPAGGFIEVRIQVRDEELRVEVQDSGPGISPANQRRLFGEIVQFNAKTLQGGGGSGLGLWISKRIIDLHGGSIGVFSEGEGKGSTFFFTLPLVLPRPKSAPDDIEHRRLQFLKQGSSSLTLFQNMLRFSSRTIFPDPTPPDVLDEHAIQLPLRSIDYLEHNPAEHRVLLVDDSSLNRKLLLRRFLREGYAVYEAVQMVRTSLESDGHLPYDIITMDNVRRLVLFRDLSAYCPFGYRSCLVSVVHVPLKKYER